MYNLPILKQLVLLLHWILVSLHDWFASIGLSEHWTWGLAIIGLTIIVRLVLFPLTWKQYKSSLHMQALQPQIKELQKKYKNDRAKLQQETMRLYQENKVNPFASCLPLLLQLPVFISLYAAIKGLGPLSAPAYQPSVKALGAASFLWIPHLGLPDPTYILLVIYIVTQLVSTELMLQTQSDPTQKWLMRAMPLIFVFILFRFPAGLFVYWVTTNIWTIGQQLIIRRTMPAPVLVTGGGGGGGKSRADTGPPKKRGRFMEAMVAAQEQRVKDRQARLDQSTSAGGGSAKGGKPGAAKTGQAKSASGKPGAKKIKRPPGKAGSPRPKPGGSPSPKPGGSTSPKPGGSTSQQ